MKKPSVFVNKIDHKISNNEKVFTSYKDENENITDSAKVNIRRKLHEIFNSPKYVYKAETVIKTNKGTIEKTIVGMNKSKLLTIDNDFINIDDIIDINLKK